MEKSANFKQKLLKAITSKGAVAGATGTAAGAGGYYAGSFMGKKKGFRQGAERTANEMAVAFHEANQRENQKIVDSFKAFNQMENRNIAQNYFKKGLVAAGGMSKSASDIYDEAFDDEFEKQAYLAGLGSKILSGIKKNYGTLKQSYKNLGEGASDAYRQVRAMRGATPAQMKVQKGYLKSGLKDTAKKSKAALGTTAAAGAAGLYAAS